MRPASITVFFKDHEVITLKRAEMYTYTDFLAICGGLLGLFVGASTLSIIEFIYYSTLRLYWSLRQWKLRNIVIPSKKHHINHIPCNTTQATHNDFRSKKRF